MVPIEAFGASDAKSMSVDNTSAFNCRDVRGSSVWSQHAYGRAIDIDPRENPRSRAERGPAEDRAQLRRSVPQERE
jgi:hypothetical protein